MKATDSGDLKAHEWIEKNYNDNKYFSFIDVVFPYQNVKKAYLEKECYYNIGMLYYDGDENIPLKSNKEKAFYWLNLAAEKGSFSGAIMAGNMAQYGDGIAINETTAFSLYNRALENDIKIQAELRMRIDDKKNSIKRIGYNNEYMARNQYESS